MALYMYRPGGFTTVIALLQLPDWDKSENCTYIRISLYFFHLFFSVSACMYVYPRLYYPLWDVLSGNSNLGNYHPLVFMVPYV